jgi:hypothetical protein
VRAVEAPELFYRGGIARVLLRDRFPAFHDAAVEGVALDAPVVVLGETGERSGGGDEEREETGPNAHLL